jgi:sulfite reductase beta subunit-like hemoprotein
MENKLKFYIRDLLHYEDDEWIIFEIINRSLYPTHEKNTKLILFHVTQQRYKDIDKLLYAAKAASEPSEELNSISANGSDITVFFANAAKKAKRLAVYSFQTTKNPHNKGS